jgi:hypothetical protein
MSNTTHIPTSIAGSQAQAFENWREAEELVAVRWHLFLKADGASSRRRMFASYVAALDAEEVAASEMALLAVADIAA